MASSDSTAIPNPSPEPPAGGSPSLAPAALSPGRLVYWSVRREFWENRYLYAAPLIVAAVFLFGFVIGAARLLPAGTAHSLEQPLDFASAAVMLAYVIVAVIYCLGALHNERNDRSILFWKSLPVSDLTTVVAKAIIPVLALPLITFAIIVATQGVMLLMGSAVLLGKGSNLAVFWAQTALLPMWAATLYHLVAVHGLYYAPLYGWLLLVSAWARRAAFFWAILPVAAALIIEKLVFNTSVFARMLLSRLGGGPAAMTFPPPHDMPMRAPTLFDVAAFLTSPGLWMGLAVLAACLVAAAWLRRRQGPV